MTRPNAISVTSQAAFSCLVGMEWESRRYWLGQQDRTMMEREICIPEPLLLSLARMRALLRFLSPNFPRHAIVYSYNILSPPTPSLITCTPNHATLPSQIHLYFQPQIDTPSWYLTLMLKRLGIKYYSLPPKKDFISLAKFECI